MVRSFRKKVGRLCRYSRKKSTLRDVRIGAVQKACKMKVAVDSELENSESKVGGCCIRSSVGEKSSNGRLGGENDDY